MTLFFLFSNHTSASHQRTKQCDDEVNIVKRVTRMNRFDWFITRFTKKRVRVGIMLLQLTAPTPRRLYSRVVYSPYARNFSPYSSSYEYIFFLKELGNWFVLRRCVIYIHRVSWYSCFIENPPEYRIIQSGKVTASNTLI